MDIVIVFRIFIYFFFSNSIPHPMRWKMKKMRKLCSKRQHILQHINFFCIQLQIFTFSPTISEVRGLWREKWCCEGGRSQVKTNKFVIYLYIIAFTIRSDKSRMTIRAGLRWESEWGMGKWYCCCSEFNGIDGSNRRMNGVVNKSILFSHIVFGMPRNKNIYKWMNQIMYVHHQPVQPDTIRTFPDKLFITIFNLICWILLLMLRPAAAAVAVAADWRQWNSTRNVRLQLVIRIVHCMVWLAFLIPFVFFICLSVSWGYMHFNTMSTYIERHVTIVGIWERDFRTNVVVK